MKIVYLINVRNLLYALQKIRRRFLRPPRVLRHRRRPRPPGGEAGRVPGDGAGHSVLVRVLDRRQRHPGLRQEGGHHIRVRSTEKA